MLNISDKKDLQTSINKLNAKLETELENYHNALKIKNAGNDKKEIRLKMRDINAEIFQLNREMSQLA